MKSEMKLRNVGVLFVTAALFLWYGNIVGASCAGDINALIQEAVANQQHQVVLPAGTCFVDAEIRVPVNFTLSGTGSDTVLVATSPMDHIILLHSDYGTTGNNVVKDLVLDGNGLAVKGVQVRGRSHVTVSNLTITGTRKQAVHVVGGSNRLPFTISSDVYDVCPEFSLALDFAPNNETGDYDDMDVSEVYEALRTCPRFPEYVPEIAKGITLEGIQVADAYLDNWEVNENSDRFGSLIGVQLVHGIEIAGCSLEGKNVQGIKVFWWGSSSSIHDNTVAVVRDEDKDISPALGIEIWHTGPFSEIYNNTVSRWLSIDSSPGSTICNNRVEFIGGERSVGIEVVASDHSRVYGNLVRGARTGISIDQGNAHTIFESNTILDTTNVGIHVVNCWKRHCERITIRNNVIDSVTSNGTGFGKRGVFFNCCNTSDSVIEYNTIKNTGGSAIYLYGTNRMLVNGNLIYCYNKDPVSTSAEAAIYFNGAENTTLDGNRVIPCGGQVCNDDGRCDVGETSHECPGDCRDIFMRGDVNADNGIDIGDAIFTLSYLFAEGTVPSCPDAADVNDDGRLDIGDAVYLFQNLFALESDILPLVEECRTDPTMDVLRCNAFPPCEPQGR